MKLFGKKLTPLLKSEAGAEELPTDQVDVAEAFNSSLEDLHKAIGDGDGEETTPPATDESPAENGGEAQPQTPATEQPATDQPATEPVEKSQVNASLESILKEDVEAGKAIDASPFLKSLVDGINKKIDGAISGITQKIETMSKSISSIGDVQRSLAKAIVAEGNLMKSMLDVDEEALNQPVDIQSAQTTERFAKSQEGSDLQVSIPQARAYLGKLAKSSISPVKINIWEKSLNKGIVHPEFLVEIQTLQKSAQ